MTGKDQSDSIAPASLLGRVVKATALAQAVVTAACDYAEKSSEGGRTIPAVDRSDTNVRAVWEDTRLEALFPFFRHGAADIVSLASLPTQPNLFAAIVEDQVQLSPMSPNGEHIHDTVQAIFLGFEYLRGVTVKAGGSYESEFRFVRSFEKKCREALPKWIEFETTTKSDQKVDLPDLPPFLVDVFWDEVTAKAKNVAVTKLYGSSVDRVGKEVVSMIRQRMMERGRSSAEIEEQVTQVQSMMDRLIEARRPDDLLGSKSR